jgi:hypothetical protein
VKLEYTTLIAHKPKKKGIKLKVAIVKIPINILKKPYRASFKTIDAKTILPDTLASE